MNNTTKWKYCVVGNIAGRHYDSEGILRSGTAAFPAGAKVYLCGKYWKSGMDTITVIGYTRGKRYQVHDVPVRLIENVRPGKAYTPKVLALMDDWEFGDLWWQDSEEDRKSAAAFAAGWHKE